MLTGRRKVPLWLPVRATHPLPLPLRVHNLSPRMERGGLLGWRPTVFEVCSPLTRSILTLPLCLLVLMSFLLMRVIQQTKYDLRTAHRQLTLAISNTCAVLIAMRQDLQLIPHAHVRHPGFYTTTHRAHRARLTRRHSITCPRRGGTGFPPTQTNCMMVLTLCGLTTGAVLVSDNPHTQHTLDTCALAMITLATISHGIKSLSVYLRIIRP